MITDSLFLLYPLPKDNLSTPFSGPRCQVSGVRCRVSGVRCQVSGVRCQVSVVRCQIIYFFVVGLVGGGSVINGAYPV